MKLIELGIKLQSLLPSFVTPTIAYKNQLYIKRPTVNSNTRLISEKLQSPKNMDGELSWEEEEVLYEPGGWEKREKDWALFEQLDLLFEANKYLPNCEEHKARLQRRISEEIVPEFGWQYLLAAIQRIEEFQRDHQRKPPGLKVLSAMAICKNFKDSEEILRFGSSAGVISWSGICDEDCDPSGLPTSEKGRLQAKAMLRMGLIEALEDWHCGFCRFSEWIKEQKLPKELEVYCKNILHFMDQSTWYGAEEQDIPK